MRYRLIEYCDEAWDWEEDEHRPPANSVYLTRIISGIRESLQKGKAQGKKSRQSAEDEREGYINAGNAFDLTLGRALDRALCDTTAPDPDHRVVTFRPRSVQVDGVWVSTDRLVVDHGLQWRFRGECPSPKVAEEHKLTWMGYEEDIEHEKFWFWLVQNMAECYAFRTCRGRIRALFINGDYRPPRPIDPVAWDLVYSPAELRDNWEMLLNFAREQGWFKGRDRGRGRGHGHGRTREQGKRR